MLSGFEIPQRERCCCFNTNWENVFQDIFFGRRVNVPKWFALFFPVWNRKKNSRPVITTRDYVNSWDLHFQHNQFNDNKGKKGKVVVSLNVLLCKCFLYFYLTLIMDSLANCIPLSWPVYQNIDLQCFCGLSWGVH